MMLQDQNISAWIEKTFAIDKLSHDEVFKNLIELGTSSETRELSRRTEFLYELAKVNSEAAFILWQIQQQNKIANWVYKIAPGFYRENLQITSTHLFPLLVESNVMVLKEGSAYFQTIKNSEIKVIEKPLAFRKLSWYELGTLGKADFTYPQNELDIFLRDEVVSIAAIVAGAKFNSYQLAAGYSAKRVQGGRVIQDWTSIQALLSKLFLSIKADEVLVKNLSVPNALFILQDADHFVSQNMQVLGGAGYTEDYIVERLYRECIFLKNWPLPFKYQLINHFQTQVLNL